MASADWRSDFHTVRRDWSTCPPPGERRARRKPGCAALATVEGEAPDWAASGVGPGPHWPGVKLRGGNLGALS